MLKLLHTLTLWPSGCRTNFGDIKMSIVMTIFFLGGVGVGVGHIRSFHNELEAFSWQRISWLRYSKSSDLGSAYCSWHRPTVTGSQNQRETRCDSLSYKKLPFHSNFHRLKGTMIFFLCLFNISDQRSSQLVSMNNTPPPVVTPTPPLTPFTQTHAQTYCTHANNLFSI